VQRAKGEVILGSGVLFDIVVVELMFPNKLERLRLQDRF
jgi:hypothetical protein